MVYEPPDANKDFLTNCYTRATLDIFLARMESIYQSDRTPFSVFIIDVDHFKFFNDKYGHLCGDEVLKYFSSSIRLDLEEETNYPFRFGGDEFMVIFPGKVAKEAYALADRLKRNVKARPCLYKGNNIKMGFSGGIACYPDDATDIQDLLDKADKALYVAKKKGRGQIKIYGSIKMEVVIRNMVVVTVLLGALLGIYLMRDVISSSFQNFVSGVKETSFMKKTLSSLNNLKELAVTPATLLVQKTLPVVVPPVIQPQPEIPPPPVLIDIVYFKDGGMLKGKIASENDETLQFQPSLSTGKGSLGLRKSDLLKIERGVPA